MRIVLKGSTERNKLAAMRILTTMHGQNIGNKVEHTHSHAHVHADLEQLRQEMLGDPDYIEYLRQNAIDTETDSDARTLCDGDESRPVEASASPSVS